MKAVLHGVLDPATIIEEDSLEDQELSQNLLQKCLNVYPYGCLQSSIGSKTWLAEIFKLKCAPGFLAETGFFNIEMYLFIIVLGAFALWLIHSFL